MAMLSKSNLRNLARSSNPMSTISHALNFKCPALCAIVAHQCGRQQVAQPHLHTQLYVGAGSQMHIGGRQPARQAGGFDLQPAILLEIGAYGRNCFLKPYARMPPLPYEDRVVWHVKGRQPKV